MIDVEEDGNNQVTHECPANHNRESNNTKSQKQPACNVSIPNGKAPGSDQSLPDFLEIFPEVTYHNIRLKVLKELGTLQELITLQILLRATSSTSCLTLEAFNPMWTEQLGRPMSACPCRCGIQFVILLPGCLVRRSFYS